MRSLIIPRELLRKGLRVLATVGIAVLALVFLRERGTAAQDLASQEMPSVVGRIDGDDLEVATATPTGVETDAAPTVVASGSEVTLRSGHAVLSLDSGGEVSICGPAHFEVIKSAGAVTLALDYGRVHPSLNSSETFTIYTPTIIATPISIGGAERDTTVGLNQTGEMCVLTAQGAMRVEPQFSDQSLIVPQGGSASLVGGQIASLHGDVAACACDFSRASVEHHREQPHAPRPEISMLAHPKQPNPPKASEPSEPAPAASEPVYTVLMPTLTFDANAPAPPPDPSPETILLVREVRMRPSVVYRGHVNPAQTQTATVTSSVPAPQKNTAAQPAESQPNLLDRMRNFFRKLTGRGPCAGSGCNG